MTGATIRHIRAQLSMSQEEFAKLLGVHQTAVSAWERGVRDPSPEHLRTVKALPRVYGLDREDAIEVRPRRLKLDPHPIDYKAEGVCVECQCRPISPGRSGRIVPRCEVCNEKSIERATQWNHARRRGAA